MYKKINYPDGTLNTDQILKINGDKVLHIPFDPDNTDYQEYLEWVAEGNEPEPADEA